MATWEQVQQRLRQDYVLDVDEPNELVLTVEHRNGGAARGQRVMVRRYDAWGNAMIEVRSAFGELGDYDPEGLLVDNLQLSLGAIALHGRFLVVVHKSRLEDLSLDGVVFLLTRISLLADALEERLGKDRF